MPSTPSVTWAFPLRDAVPKIIPSVNSTVGLQRNCFPFPQPTLSARKPGPSPAVLVRVRRVLTAPRFRADKKQRACGRHPREAISPDFGLPRRSGPTASPGLIRRRPRISAAPRPLRAPAARDLPCHVLTNPPVASSAPTSTTSDRAVRSPGPAPFRARPFPAPPRATLGEAEPRRETPGLVLAFWVPGTMAESAGLPSARQKSRDSRVSRKAAGRQKGLFLTFGSWERASTQFQTEARESLPKGCPWGEDLRGRKGREGPTAILERSGKDLRLDPQLFILAF